MKKTRNISILALLIGVAAVLNACKEEFLEIEPNGALGQGVLATADGVDAVLIGAYSMVDGTSNLGLSWQAASSNWVFGSIRGMVANKGTDSGDQPDINPIQTFSEASNNPYLDIKWRSVYEGVDRANNTIVIANRALEEGSITDAQHASFVNQARVLRGFFHFEGWRMWDGMIPYVDENTDRSQVPNDVDIRTQIEQDLLAGTNLDENMGQVGRFNKTVSQVLLAKARMQMYGDYGAETQALLTAALAGTKPNGEAIGLAPTYGEIFDIENRNGIESVYTVQYSVNDNSGGWNGGFGEVLNFPYKSGGSPGGCCGFHQPTQEFVNSFRTAGGLPLLDGSYNDDPVLNDDGLTPDDPSYVEDPGPLDPRLDWSVGRRGIPYLDWGDHTGQDWIRDQSYAGPFSPKKQVYRKAQEGTFTEVGNWTSGWTANGYRLIRYSDVMLLLAECQAKSGTGDLGLALVNQVRARAANPAGFVMETDGTPAANYDIAEYGGFANQDEAIAAVLMERKLELGTEGHRYFDLLRMGDAFIQAELNRVLAYEAPLRSALYGNATFGPEDVSFPVPQNQIDQSANIVQNR